METMFIRIKFKEDTSSMNLPHCFLLPRELDFWHLCLAVANYQERCTADQYRGSRNCFFVKDEDYGHKSVPGSELQVQLCNAAKAIEIH